MPVRLGVNTSWPASRSGPWTLRKPCAPPHAPCTRTKTAISVTIAERAASPGHLPWRIRQQRAEYLPAHSERGRLAECLPGDLRVGGRPRGRAGGRGEEVHVPAGRLCRRLRGSAGARCETAPEDNGRGGLPRSGRSIL